MAEPFIGEIKMFGGNFAPRGYALCDGQLLPIAQNQALFSLLGTIYGGDGRTTFALPDLRGRAPIHAGGGAGLTNRRLGERGGAETNTLVTNQMPSHNHTISVPTTSHVADDTQPAGNRLGQTRADVYSQGVTGVGTAEVRVRTPSGPSFIAWAMRVGDARDRRRGQRRRVQPGPRAVPGCARDRGHRRRPALGRPPAPPRKRCRPGRALAPCPPRHRPRPDTPEHPRQPSLITSARPRRRAARRAAAPPHSRAAGRGRPSGRSGRPSGPRPRRADD